MELDYLQIPEKLGKRLSIEATNLKAMAAEGVELEEPQERLLVELYDALGATGEIAKIDHLNNVRHQILQRLIILHDALEGCELAGDLASIDPRKLLREVIQILRGSPLSIIGLPSLEVDRAPYRPGNAEVLDVLRMVTSCLCTVVSGGYTGAAQADGVLAGAMKLLSAPSAPAPRERKVVGWISEDGQLYASKEAIPLHRREGSRPLVPEDGL